MIQLLRKSYYNKSMNLLLKHNFTFIDVETPNFSNSAISSIGLIHINTDGEIIEKYTLVNPNQHFDTFNIELTGITPEMVKDAPVFKEVWNDIKEYFEDSILVAHNARFDLGVISKCLIREGLPIPNIRYMCTVDLSRKYIPSKSHKLNVLCDLLDIELIHHQADSDTKACMELFLYMNEKVELQENEIKDYVVKNKYFR